VTRDDEPAELIPRDGYDERDEQPTEAEERAWCRQVRGHLARCACRGAEYELWPSEAP